LFIGRFKHNLDSKNRVTIPKRFLEQVRKTGQSQKYYITKGMEECLFFFTEERFEELTHLFNSLTLAKSKVRKFLRHFFSYSNEVELDGSGRILIPEPLKEAAGLKKEVFFLGAGDQVEIWDADKWTSQEKELSGEISEIAEDLF